MRPTIDSTRGFTLVEIMISTALFMVVLATLFAIVAPARDLFAVQPDVQDLQQRLRLGVETLHRSLAAAGAGVGTGHAAGALHHAIAVIRPYRIGQRADDAAAGVFYRPDRLSVVTVPVGATPATIRALHRSGATVSVEVDSNCASGLCGFAAGDHVMAVDRWGHSCWGTIESLRNRLLLVHGAPLDCRTNGSADAILAPVDLATYSLAIDRATGVSRLMRYNGGASEMPVLDDVVSLAFEYEGDPAPPALRSATADSDSYGPWTTYGPAPPPPDVDDPTDSWPAGENCVFVLLDGRQVPRLPRLLSSAALVALTPPMLTDGPWCPDGSSPGRFDADLLRIRRVRVVLRLQVTRPFLRRAGEVAFPPVHAQGAGQVADQEIRFVVSPRNLSPAIE